MRGTTHKPEKEHKIQDVQYLRNSVCKKEFVLGRITYRACPRHRRDPWVVTTGAYPNKRQGQGRRGASTINLRSVCLDCLLGAPASWPGHEFQLASAAWPGNEFQLALKLTRYACTHKVRQNVFNLGSGFAEDWSTLGAVSSRTFRTNSSPSGRCCATDVVQMKLRRFRRL